MGLKQFIGAVFEKPYRALWRRIFAAWAGKASIFIHGTVEVQTGGLDDMDMRASGASVAVFKGGFPSNIKRLICGHLAAN